ncbi:GNAT family N-acetyltransferase [Mycobacterium sp. CBMA293]|uniref:GNAT family N-acetyltransferase n=1 Tax=unclassified Mycolicibacterium TaxID=2636767 RepID=UPI0012DC7000|nr:MULTISPECIES: GNAT family N-acetyltransferase [unclassified Mycolicibacterium]MUL48259.1 GNAT family N-acetyltransferase [Mycolicibacterium sp. CBMA 360]MUL57573.1 GNAT family N-acetyltransferase [Mycolicibacterium sp. CBMA 335]MUL70613.1 GNAT family N-acetyltransferase [Mycolicibacterium sp. CBMA 311]MUL92661.1 GNAT family N-acetyltransferase [Mycolicibacterium sp. CBMA 230]MUM08326.1 GNAT family N-acetyltransferase [Mycolicibacterium sp. CBMA 213]
MTDLTLRTVSDGDDYEAFTATTYAAFFDEAYEDEIDLARAFTEFDRMFGFHDGSRWVATAGAFSKHVMLPGGGSTPVAAVTAVSVSPSHRRRGLLTAMMRHQLDDIRSRGTEALAMLYASEASIYGRFGYGMATSAAELSGQVRELGFRPEVQLGNGSVTDVDAETLMASAPEIHQQAMVQRPGLMDRPRPWWDHWIHDSEKRRKDASKLRFVLHHEADGTASGFAIYRPKNGWTDRGQPNSELHIREVRATNHLAYAQIWRYLLDVDLVRTVEYDVAAVDETLRYLVADQRALSCEVRDGIYVRLVDVGRALTLRSYAAPVDVVLDIADEFCPWNAGRWRLCGGPDGAECETTTAPADIAISARDLGAIYLGGVSLQALANAGLVEELTPGAVHRTAVAFGWPVAPGVPDDF